LTAATSMTLSQDSAFVGRGRDPDRAIEIVERLWLYALWGGNGLAANGKLQRLHTRMINLPVL
jgi:hypothetical protein